MNKSGKFREIARIFSFPKMRSGQECVFVDSEIPQQFQGRFVG